MRQRPRRELAARAVRDALDRSGMSVSDLARESGINAADLTERLAGEVAFDVDQLESVGTALGMPIESLLGER